MALLIVVMLCYVKVSLKTKHYNLMVKGHLKMQNQNLIIHQASEKSQLTTQARLYQVGKAANQAAALALHSIFATSKEKFCKAGKKT